MKNILITTVIMIMALMFSPAYSQDDSSNINQGYAYIGEGKTQAAITVFENHLLKNPDDTRIYLQLSYEYLKLGNKEKAIQYLRYVKNNSKNPEEILAAEKQLAVMQPAKTETYSIKNNFVDLYSYNFYDSHQDNVIANLLMKYNNKIIYNLYGGLYGDVYTDSRSTKNEIYNDRYIEAGGFLRYSLLPSLSVEFRAGYVREVDHSENSFNFKPIIMYSDRFSTANMGTNYYINVYSSALYDHKFRNFFGQISLMQAISFPVSTSSSIEPYIRQSVLGDTKGFDYNNYAEIGAGVQYAFKSIFLPTIFFEGTEKLYFNGNQSGSFQIKAGLLFNFYKFIW